MSLWRHEAIKRLPELQHIISSQNVESPMMLWIELNGRFHKLCEQEDPPVDVLKRVWQYAEWCLMHHNSPEVRTAAALGFCEHLIDNPQRAKMVPKIMKKSDFLDLKSLLLYHNDEATYDRWLEALWSF